MMRFTYNNNANVGNNTINFMPVVRPPPPKPQLEIQEEKTIAKPEKQMKWGEPVWFLFHTLAQKIKEDTFLQVKDDFLKIIYSICANLPCPTCAQHATEYMNKVNFNRIRTKQELMLLFFEFHNAVNKNKGYAQFQYENLEEKYSKAITINIIHNFIFHFQHKSKSLKMIANELHRGKLINNLKIWFNNNIQYFDN
jgi:translation elongation factor EF-4